MRRGAWLFLAAAGLPGVLRAQEAIPAELARGLLAGPVMGFDQGVQITVGGPPKQWAIEPLPDFRLLGSAESIMRAMLVYEVTGDVYDAREQALDVFKTAGWREPELPEGLRARQRGLMPPSPMAGGSQNVLCKGDRAVMLHPIQLDRAQQVLHVTYHGATGASVCNPPRRTVGYPDPYAHVPMPTLQPPADAQVHLRGAGGSGDSYRQTAVGRMDLTVKELLAWYAGQLKAAGWQMADSAEGANVALAKWALEQNQKSWLITLTANAINERDRIIELGIYDLAQLRF